MKANAVSALVLGAFLCTASAVVAQTPVGSPAIDEDRGSRYGWAVDFERTGAVGVLGDCRAGCPAVPPRGGRPAGYLDSASALGLRVYPRPSSAEQQRQSSPSSSEVEGVFWETIATSTNPADFEAYLAQFPDGAFRALAEARLARLRSASGGDPPRRPGGVLRDCPSCPEMVVIPAGEFQMGSPEEWPWEEEQPQHRVRVGRFALGRYEVTRAEYAAFSAATGRDPDSCFAYTVEWRPGQNWRSPGYPQTDEHPVVCVSWDDARAYVRWLSRETGANYRLPSEAEWEYAARGGTTTRWYWGEDSTGQCSNANGADAAARRRWEDWAWAVPCNDGRVFTAPVGMFGANGFGLFDVAGNAEEWVEDCWHDDYRGAPADGRAWTSGGDCDRRVHRGGSWSGGRTALSSTHRGSPETWSSSNYVGFRVARTLD